MASLFLSPLVIFLLAVSAIESTVVDLTLVHAFHKTSNHVKAYPLNMPYILESRVPPSPRHAIPTPINVYPLNIHFIP